MTKRTLKSQPIFSEPGIAPGEITLREWKPGEEWVTHFHNLEDDGYYYGRYFTKLADAEADYEQRVKERLGGSKRLVNPIKVSPIVLEGLNAVRQAKTTNMFDINVVKVQAVALGFLETAEWIENNIEVYSEGIFRGFDAEVKE